MLYPYLNKCIEENCVNDDLWKINDEMCSLSKSELIKKDREIDEEDVEKNLKDGIVENVNDIDDKVKVKRRRRRRRQTVDGIINKTSIDDNVDNNEIKMELSNNNVDKTNNQTCNNQKENGKHESIEENEQEINNKLINETIKKDVGISNSEPFNMNNNIKDEKLYDQNGNNNETITINTDEQKESKLISINNNQKIDVEQNDVSRRTKNERKKSSKFLLNDQNGNNIQPNDENQNIQDGNNNNNNIKRRRRTRKRKANDKSGENHTLNESLKKDGNTNNDILEEEDKKCTLSVYEKKDTNDLMWLDSYVNFYVYTNKKKKNNYDNNNNNICDDGFNTVELLNEKTNHYISNISLCCENVIEELKKFNFNKIYNLETFKELKLEKKFYENIELYLLSIFVFEKNKNICDIYSFKENYKHINDLIEYCKMCNIEKGLEIIVKCLFTYLREIKLDKKSYVYNMIKLLTHSFLYIPFRRYTATPFIFISFCSLFRNSSRTFMNKIIIHNFLIICYSYIMLIKKQQVDLKRQMLIDKRKKRKEKKGSQHMKHDLENENFLDS